LTNESFFIYIYSQELNQNEGGSKWSLSELVHAIVVMCHFHAFSSFVLGCGVMDNNPQDDKPSKGTEIVPI